MSNEYIKTTGELIAEHRKNAGLSQGAVAEKMGVQQATVSRWEAGEDSPSIHNIVRLTAIFGVSVEHLVPIQKGDPHKIGKRPYKEFVSRVEAAKAYMAGMDAEVISTIDPNGAARAQLNQKLNRFAGKPLLAIIGRFDAGKSTFLNYLLGGDVLPANYQPATRVPTVLLHKSHKPAYLKEDENVLVIRGRDIWGAVTSSTLPDDRVTVGTESSLKSLVTHDGQSREESAESAIVFLNAEILENCSLLDSPGLSNDAKDTNAAQCDHLAPEALIYAAPFAGFMDATDMAALGHFLGRLPLLGTKDSGGGPLDNLIILATRCDAKSSPEDIDAVRASASKRVKAHVSSALELRSGIYGQEISFEDILSRMTTFELHTPKFKQAASAAINDLLESKLPRFWVEQSANDLRALTGRCAKEAAARFDDASNRIHNEDAARRSASRFQEEKETIKGAAWEAKDKINLLVHRLRDEAECEVRGRLWELFDEGNIERIITEVYSDRDEANRYVGALFSDKVNAIVSDRTRRDAECVKREMDGIVARFQSSMNSLKIPETEFDFGGLLLSSLVATGTVGLLAAWGIAAAAGSNLGGYIAVAQLASFLGINSFWATGAVAALGGPVVVVFAAAAIVGLLVWGFRKFFGPTWQRQLAQNVRKGVNEKNTVDHVVWKLKESYSQTLGGLDSVFGLIVAEIDRTSENLNSRVGAEDREKLKENAALLNAAQVFFSRFPLWDSPIK